jgi:DNA-binding MarR family transcriptional regulator
MTFATIKWARKLPLCPTDKHVLVDLASQANSKAVCWPSYATIAEATGYSIPTIERSIKRLAKAGLIEKKLRYDKRGKRTSNYYQLMTGTTHHSDGKSKSTTHHPV